MFGTKLERYKEELRQEGVEEGRQEGETEAAITFARRLLLRGDSVQAVAEITELPIEKVRALADQIRDEE